MANCTSSTCSLSGSSPMAASAVVFVGVAAFLPALDGALGGAVLDERAFREPLIVGHAEFIQVLADVIEDDLEAEVEHLAVGRRAEQRFGALDEGIDVFFLVTAGRFIGRHAVEYFGGGVLIGRPVFAAQRGA